jgi:hypothetical protein
MQTRLRIQTSQLTVYTYLHHYSLFTLKLQLSAISLSQEQNSTPTQLRLARQPTYQLQPQPIIHNKDPLCLAQQ